VIRQDYFERMIEQLAAAIARVAGLVAGRKYQDAGREVEGCYRTIGITRDMLVRLSPETIGAMFGPGKGDAVARVLDAEADLLRAQGRGAEAQSKKRDAAALRRAVGR
jgi:hypothetical protein